MKEKKPKKIEVEDKRKIPIEIERLLFAPSASSGDKAYRDFILCKNEKPLFGFKGFEIISQYSAILKILIDEYPNGLVQIDGYPFIRFGSNQLLPIVSANFKLEESSVVHWKVYLLLLGAISLFFSTRVELRKALIKNLVLKYDPSTWN